MKYFCTNCSAEYLKWSGKCSACGEWDSLQEVIEEKSDTTKRSVNSKPKLISEFGTSSKVKNRIDSGFSEFNRVLGGGIVTGSISLVAGEPGVGKSTLLSQVAINISNKEKVLYVSGEESGSQIYSRIKRLSHNNTYSNLFVSEETNIENIVSMVEEMMPSLVIVDSVQSLSSETVRSYAGSIGQVRVSGAKLTRMAKDLDVAVLVIGQINKDGNVAGPKVLEHIVDTVLYFEGGEHSQFRVLRAIKNRFGATDEIGVFEMSSDGLIQIENPSQAFLEQTDWGIGSALGVTLKGSRVVFLEIQALVVEKVSDMGPLKRVANGVKKPRLDMLCAVLSRRGGLYLGDKDVFVNVVGGIEVDDPALDLSICMAIKAAIKDEKISNENVYYGEVGLTGGIRKGLSIKSIEKESKRLGYKLVSKTSSLNNIKQL